MTPANPEFSRPVALARIGAEPLRREFAANAAEREALAQRFGLVGLARLTAIVELVRQAHGTILLTATIEAEFTQECVVSLEPVPGSLATEFALRYGPPEAEQGLADPAVEAEAFEPLVGDTIDLGEAVAQEFALALPPFPRHPDAAVESGADAPPLANPFAALAARDDAS